MGRDKIDIIAIRELFRYSFVEKLSLVKTGKACGIGKQTVKNYLDAIKGFNLGWDKINSMDDIELMKIIEQGFYNRYGKVRTVRKTPDFKNINNEIKKPGTTLLSVWKQYNKQNPDGYKYPMFCRLCKNNSEIIDNPDFDFKAGQSLFVKYCVNELFCDEEELVDNKIKSFKLLIAMWGMSKYVYLEAFQTGEDTRRHEILSLNRAFRHFNCVPKYCIFVNGEYAPLKHLTHYDFFKYHNVIPQNMQDIPQNINRCFKNVLSKVKNNLKIIDTTHNANQQLKNIANTINATTLDESKRTISELFNNLERKYARNLPNKTYEYTLCKYLKVGVDSHVEIFGIFYSVPHKYIGKKLTIKITPNSVNIYSGDKPVTSHEIIEKGFLQFQTNEDHVNSAPTDIFNDIYINFSTWAKRIGPNMGNLAGKILNSLRYKIHIYRFWMILINFKKYILSEEEIEKAAITALASSDYAMNNFIYALNEIKNIKYPNKKKKISKKRIKEDNMEDFETEDFDLQE